MIRDRYARRYLAGCALWLVGAATCVLASPGASSLAGVLVVAAGSLVMARTAHAAGA